MQRTPLYLYLETIASGDESAIPKLCRQLADRLVYVPIFHFPENAGRSSTLTVQAVRIENGDEKSIPIFTTEKLYKSWAATCSEKTKFISLLGGDLCGALGSNSSVVIDPGTVHSVVLGAAHVREVAEAVSDELGGTGSPINAVPEQLRGRAELTSFMKRPSADNSSDQKLLGDSSESGSSTPKSGLFNGAFAAGRDDAKSEGYNSFADSGADDDADTNALKQRSQSFDRPVIFSPNSDSNRVVRDKEDPQKKKRKSFLKFLTGKPS